jgi:hypothetical protein
VVADFNGENSKVTEVGVSSGYVKKVITAGLSEKGSAERSQYAFEIKDDHRASELSGKVYVCGLLYL